MTTAHITSERIDDIPVLMEWLLGMHVDEVIDVARITARSRVLELGCGTGGISCYVAGRTGCTLDGLDWSRVAVTLAAQRARDCGLESHTRFHLVDFRNLESPLWQFDIALAVDALYSRADLARIATWLSAGLGTRGRVVTLITVRSGAADTVLDHAGSDLPYRCNLDDTFRLAGFAGSAVVDLTASYSELVNRMLLGWRADLPILRTEVGPAVASARLREDELLLARLLSGSLQRILFHAWKDE